MLYIKESVLNEEDTHNDYPAAAKKNAQKAIDWKEKYGRDEVDAGTPVGWARAHQLAKGENLSTDTVKRMSAFNRHRKNSSIKPELKETPWKDRGYVAWLIWGGDEGVDWAIEKSKEIDAMKESKQLKYIKPLNEAEKYITDEFKVGDKIKTNFGEWEVIETDYAPNKSFIAPFIFKGKDMERVNIPNPPKTNKKAVGYKVTDGDKYPIIGFLYQYKDITKLATVGVDESVDEARSSKEKFEEEEAEFKRIIASPDKRVYDLVDYAQFTTGGMTQKQWEMFMYGRYKKHLQSRDAKIKGKMYDVLTKWLTESVNEEKIKYVKGKTYQSSGHWTVVVDSNSSGLDIRVNHSAGWRLDPHDEKEETFELLDNGRQRATLYFKSGNIDKFAKQMFDLNDRTTHGNATKLTAKDYADIIRVWIDMRMANESVVVKRKLVKTLNEYFSGYEYDKFIKEFGKIKYPKYIGVKMKELVAGGFLDKVYNKEANYMAFWLNQMGKRKFDTDARKKELGEVGYKLTDRYWHDLTGSTAFTLLAAEAACEVSKHVEDLIANKEAVEPAYYLMKEYFNNHDMETNRSRIFTMAVEKLEKWMTENSIETL